MKEGTDMQDKVNVIAVISDRSNTQKITAETIVVIGINPDTTYIMGENNGSDLILASAKSVAAMILKMADGNQQLVIKNKDTYIKAFEKIVDNAMAAQKGKTYAPETEPDIVH